jgi:hypothetical protein
MRGLLLVIAAGCWHEAPPPVIEPPPVTDDVAVLPPRHRAPPGLDCNSLAAPIERVLAGTGMVLQVAQISEVVTESCAEDDWSAELIGCFAAAADEHQLRTCVETMASEQRDKLVGRLTTAMQAASMPPPTP